ncbi:unnamed protein product [Auanema sp. JU1783]|nr:unnamed protein product [Auanema sp. JU1783]
MLYLFTLALLFRVSTAECPFNSEFCHWQIQQPWRVVTEALLPSPLNLPPTSLKSDGEFLLAQGYYGINSSGTVVSPLLEGFVGNRVLTFSYSKTGGAAVLQVQIKEGLEFRTLQTIDTPSLQTWSKSSTIVPDTPQIHQIVFRITSVTDGFDALAIDDVRLASVNGKVISPESTSNINILSGDSFADRDIRRSPSDKSHQSICRAIKCQFQGNSCYWNSIGFKSLEDKVISENAEGVLTSEPVLLPINSHLQISIFSSDSSLLSIYQKIGSEEVLLWSQGGVPLPGWNSFRIPIKYVSLPSHFVIRSTSSSGNFLAISQTNLVDEKGRDLACGLNTPAIKPHRDGTVRLTALQQIHDDSPVNSKIGPPPPMFLNSLKQKATSLPVMNLPNTPEPSPIPIFRTSEIARSNFAVAPIAPAIISSSAHEPIRFNSSVIKASPTITEKLSSFGTPTEKPLIAQTTSSLSGILSAAAGRPISSEEVSVLKDLAKRFGITELSPSQLTRLIMTGKKFNSFSGILSDVSLTTPTPEGAGLPISAVTNNLSSLISSMPKEHLQMLNHLPPNLHDAITSKLGKFIENTPKNENRHFARNVDYAVQRAFNDYIVNSRP